ncbi:MAG TPA: choice-of-anchor D domain-containing protein, partial [Actinomycetota bacterium]|nr:choice-of-anchor D domain-containing protein [Actinomycetota bacterium]
EFALSERLTPADEIEVEAGRWAREALQYFTRWCAEHQDDLGRILQEIDTLLAVLDRARREGPGEDFLRLARLVEPALVLGRRWGAWRHLLDQELALAATIGNREAAAWAVHQLGTRALGERRVRSARRLLRRALRERKGLKDRAGARLTRHNLRLSLVPLLTPFVAVTLVVLAGLGLVLVPLLGREPAPVGVTPDAVDFGDVRIGVTEQRDLTVENRGDRVVRSIRVTNPAVADFAAFPRCPESLEPGRGCSVTVAFTPGTAGPIDGEMLIRFAGEGGPVRVPMHGNGVPRADLPAVSLDRETVEFGDHVLNDVALEIVTVESAGQATLAIESVRLEEPGEFTVSGEQTTCVTGLRLAQQETCAIAIVFVPSARGLAEGRVVIEDNATGSPHGIAVNGTGVTDKPDLVVDGFSQTGPPTPGDSVAIPVEVVVLNDGDVPAGPFKVSVEFLPSGSEQPFPVAFMAVPTDDVDPGGFYAFTTHDLEPDQRIVFTGVLRFQDNGSPQPGQAVAIADSCVGDELIDRSVCRVTEVDEGNNRSEPLPLDVPTFVVPAPTLLTATFTNEGLLLQWVPPEDVAAVAGYRIRRNGAIIGEVDPATSAFIDTSDLCEGEYLYQVVAFNGFGSESASADDTEHVVC